MKECFEIEIQNKSVLGIMHYNSQRISSADEISCIVVCYGFNGDRVDQHRILHYFSNYISNTNSLCVRFDYRNHGLSGGRFMYASFEEKCQDVVAVIAWLRERFPNKRVRICLLGFSDGAKIVMEVYLKYQCSISQIILWNPVLSISQTENRMRNHDKMKENRKMVLHPVTRKPVIRFLGLWVNPSLMRAIQNDNYIGSLITCDLPLAIFWGGNDIKTFDVRQTINQHQLCEKIHQYVVIGADHLFSDDKAKDELFEKTMQFTCTSGIR